MQTPNQHQPKPIQRFTGSRSSSTTDGPTRRSVLIVDDDPHMRTWLTRSFESLGYAVRSAEDQQSAEAILATAHVDAVILDLRLGERSGLDLLDVIRGRFSLARVPVLMLTGVARMTEDEEQSIRRNGAYVFYKPAAMGEIKATLDRLFAAD